MADSSKHEARDAGATTRTRSKIVNFSRPFSLSAIDGGQPAGAYTIETDEEMIGSVSFPAYHRTATWIRLPSAVRYAGVPAGLDRVINVDPTELDAALARDFATPEGGIAAEARQRPAAHEAAPRHEPTLREGPIPQPRRKQRNSAKFTVQDWFDANKSDLTWIALASFGLLILGFLMRFDIAAH